MGAARDITIALLEGMARRVGEELAERAIRRTQKRQTKRPDSGTVRETSPTETPRGKGL